MPLRLRTPFWLLLSVLPLAPLAAQMDEPARVKATYDRQDVMIPMRDGVRLFTTIYTPKDAKGSLPILLSRTPYGTDTFLMTGDFVQVRPFNPNKKGTENDEASDTYDMIDWLVKNQPATNGNVGVWGVSYLGFYSTMAALSRHPALKAVSPQAPVTDWSIGDDFHHNGALFLADGFDFMSRFGLPRKGPSRERLASFRSGTPDGYQFYLEPGSLAAFSAKHMGNSNPFGTEMFAHPTYDAFWKARTPLPHLKDVQPAMMTVGSWFDAEDVWGSVHTYQAVEKQNPGHPNMLVMGPWYHGQWWFDEGSQLGEVRWGSKTSDYYNANILLPFFNYYLKGKGDGRFPEAQVYETGVNQWRTFDAWPPATARREAIYLGAGGALSVGRPARALGFEKAVPFVPNQVDKVEFELPDVPHPFKAGHRLMIQVQSTWFLLADRNP